ncbi:hypothetical protein LCGC14_0967020, partial [marine sediment metagenome]
PGGKIFVTSYGQITVETTFSLINMAIHTTKLGLDNIVWEGVSGLLVDKTRNECGTDVLKAKAEWLWFIDGDMVFEPNLVEHMFNAAFNDCQWADIIGGYCNLRGWPYLPTIDCGSGQWEAHDANIGPVEVIRTGAACLLIKRHVLEKMAYPWFGVKPAAQPIDNLAEVDNFLRTKYDGVNPFADDPKWKKACAIAAENSKPTRGAHESQRLHAMGEDSNFCDKAKALGFRIVVQTNAVCRHVDKKIIGPKDHMEALEKARENERLLVGAA